MEEVIGSVVVRGLRTALGLVAWFGDVLLAVPEFLLDRDRKRKPRPKRGRKK